MHKKHWKYAWSAALAGLLAIGTSMGEPLLAQDAASMLTVPIGLQGDLQLDLAPIQYVQSAHFAIPFEVDRTGRLPSEVNLWVSPDRGKSWLKYATNSPDKRSFEFHAAAEGEYLFAVQTRDDLGASALAAAPPMRIQVDATRPQVDLTADLNSSGRLVITYKIAEDHLSDDCVKLEYALDSQSKWQEIRPGILKREGELWTSSIEMEMPRCRELELKITVTDKAQNVTESAARYNAPRTAQANSGMQLASGRTSTKPQALGQAKPNPQSPRQTGSRIAQLGNATQANEELNEPLAPTAGGIAWEPSSTRANASPDNSSRSWTRQSASNDPSSGATRSLPKRLGQTISSQQPGLQLNDDEPLGQASLGNQPVEELPTPTAVEDLPAGRPVFSQSPDNVSTQSETSQLSISQDNQPKFGQSESPALNSIIEKMNSTPGAAPGGLPTNSTAVPPYTPPTQPTPTASTPVQPSTTPRATDAVQLEERLDSVTPDTADTPSASGNHQTNSTHSNDSGASDSKDAYHSRSRSFSLDYSVESLRGLAISDIELWGTTDRGNTWERWGSDPDRESPFDVQVGDDGLFGFRMVIIGQNGMVSNRPQDGDTADMWINVDTSMPTVKITRALYGEGDEAGMLVIDYTATDENLHDRPITLSFSERPTGPWTTVANGLRNTGIYLWKADPKLPEQVYVRIQAVDRAGNQQEHRLELPINLRGLTPRGRIQGFRPIDTTSAKP